MGSDSMTESNQSVLYLGASDILSMGISFQEVLSAIDKIIEVYRLDRTISAPKALLNVVNGPRLQAMPAYLPHKGISSMKWLSILPRSDIGPSIVSTLLVNDLQDGRLLAIMDGGWITAQRTAAMSALAARALAKADSRRIGFIGVGVQARSNLEALMAVLPDIAEVTVLERGSGSSVDFCRFVVEHGLEARATSVADECVKDQDIIVSSVPSAGLSKPFLDANNLKAGAFATLVDLGRSWLPDSLQRIEVVATDDRQQSSMMAASGKMNHAGPYHFDLTELTEGLGKALPAASRRIFIFGGISICDMALGALCFEKACESGIGRYLPSLLD
jgi:alanine dehydrogenase